MADKSVRVILSANASGFVAELRRAGAAVREMNSEIGKASQTGEWKNLSNTIGGIGLAAAAVVGVAVKAFADFDAQMSAVAATGDEARGSLDALREAAISAGADTKYSATEAAAGIEALLKAGLSASDVLDGGLSGALNLAASGNLSVADSAETAAVAIKQFGLEGKDASHVADLLAAGAGKAVGEVSDMAAALKQSGLVASQMGLSIEETTGALAAFAQAGLIGSDAGTSLKTMLQRLMNPSKEAAQTMQELGISAYDAQGNFVGMTALAGQLDSALKPLPQAQRDAAMATIFGSDAIRAANVLYTEGASGIAGWIAAVDDQGYAAEQAAQKMDNLKGDLEQLGGSFETLMIRGGEAGDGPLRALVQQLTELVNVAAKSPEAAQSVVALVAGLAGFALVAAGIMKTVTAVSEFRSAITSLNVAMPRTTDMMGRVAKAAGVVAIGLAAVSLAAKALSHEGQMEGVKEGEGRLKELAKSADVSSASLSKFFQDASAGGGSTDLVAGVNDLASAFSRIENTTASDAVQSFVYPLVGQKTELSYVNDQFTKLDEALSNMDGQQAAAAFQKISATAKEQGVDVERLISLFPEYQAELRATAADLGVTGLSAQELADWMGGKVPPAVQAAADAARQSGKATTDLGRATDATTRQVQLMVQAQQDLSKAIQDSADAALRASGSAIAYEAAIDAAAESVAKNGKNLDISTEAGRANRSALDDIAASSLSMLTAQQAAGASTADLTAKTQAARSAFVSSAVQMGMNQAEAEKLADKYGLIPGKVATNVTNNAQEAEAKVSALLAEIAKLPPSKQTQILSIFQSQGVDAARSALDNINGKTATTYVKTVYTSTNDYGPGSAGYEAGRAYGGIVYGPGGPRDDAIRVRLSNGEFVVNAFSTARNRALLEHINRGGTVPGFANGGLVSSSPTPSWSASTTVNAAAPIVNVSVAIDGSEVRHIARVEATDVVAGVAQARQRGRA